MAAFFDGLRNGKGSIPFADYIVLEGVVIAHKLFGDPVGFDPCIIYFFHDDEVQVVSVGDSRAAEVDQVIAAWRKGREDVGFLLIIDQPAYFGLKFQLFFLLGLLFLGLFWLFRDEGE